MAIGDEEDRAWGEGGGVGTRGVGLWVKEKLKRPQRTPQVCAAHGGHTLLPGRRGGGEEGGGGRGRRQWSCAWLHENVLSTSLDELLCCEYCALALDNTAREQGIEGWKREDDTHQVQQHRGVVNPLAPKVRMLKWHLGGRWWSNSSRTFFALSTAS